MASAEANGWQHGGKVVGIVVFHISVPITITWNVNGLYKNVH